MANQKVRYMFDPRTLLATFSPDTEVSTIAEALGCDRLQVYRWLSGTSRWDCWQADRHAIRIGLHPATVWGQQWWDECAAAEERIERRYQLKLHRMRTYRERTNG